MSRLRSRSSLNEMASQLCDGDTTIFSLCMDIGVVEPESLRRLDQLEIYGLAIVQLYTEVCNRNLTTTCLILQACVDSAFTALTPDILIHAVNNRGAGVNADEIVAKIKAP